MKTKITGTADSREVFINGEPLDPAESQRVRNQSPTGFNWGYIGDGCVECRGYFSGDFKRGKSNDKGGKLPGYDRIGAFHTKQGEVYD